MPGPGSRDSSHHVSNVFGMPGPLNSGVPEASHHQAPRSQSTPPIATTPPSKVNWDTVLDRLPYGLIVLGPTQDLRYENSVCREMLGCSVGEKDSIEAWLAALCPDDEHRDRVIESWREHIWRNQLTRTFSLRGAEQKLREIEFRSSLHPDGSLTLTFEDVTDLRRAEETQRHNKLKFRTIFAQAENGAVLVDRTGRVIDANPAFLKLSDLSLKEIRLSTVASLIHPEDAAALSEAEERWRNSDDDNADTVSLEIWLRTRVKEKRTRLTYCPIGDSRRNPSMGIYLFQETDSIESRQLLIDRLRTVATKAQSLLNAVPDLVLLINDDMSVADFAPPPRPWEELQPDDSWLGCSLLDIWPVLGELIQNSCHQIVSEGKTVHADMEGHGSIPFQFNATICSCGANQMLAVIRNQAQVHHAPAPSSPVLQHTSQAIFVSDEGGRIREANTSLASLVGIPVSEMLGLSVNELYQPAQDLEEKLSTLLSSGDTWRCSLPLLRQSGREVSVVTEFVPVDEKGSPPCVVGLIQDSVSSGNAATPSPEKIQHRFRNQLQLVTSLFSLEPQGTAARDAFLKWQIRLRAVAQTMTGLAETGVQVIPMMRTIADEICSLTGHGPGNRVIEITGDDTLRIDQTNASSLALLIGETMRLILAQKQYGPGPEIFFKLYQDDAGNLRLHVKPGENRQFIFTDEDSEVEILEILTAQMRGELAPLASESALAWELMIPSEQT